MKVRIKSAPVDGQANAALIRFLAKECGVAKGRVRLLSGATNRDKLVEIESPARVPEALRAEMR